LPPRSDQPRVALLCVDPVEDEGVVTPTYSSRKLQAALLASPRLTGVDVRVLESQTKDPAWLVGVVRDLEPDVIGASAYLWSFPTLVEVARAVKRERPECLVVFGGPSARPAMFALEPFRDAARHVDVLVAGEGEEVLQELVAARLGGGDLAAVPGIVLRSATGWSPTSPRTTRPGLDDLASPYQMGLMPPGSPGRLETFRGCPMVCTFCQQRGPSPPDRVLSVDYLVRELRAFRELDVPRVCLDSSALNLNSRAFRNLVTAERQVGFLAECRLSCEVYPSHLTPAHLEFLRDIRIDLVGVGVQSLNDSVLSTVRRRHEEARLERVVTDLAEIANVNAALELILGLPGEDPQSFMATLDRLERYPCTIRTSHCRVLPDALMSDHRARTDLRFDPMTLKVISCTGWSAQALTATRAALAERTRERGGRVLRDWWEYPTLARLQCVSARGSAVVSSVAHADAPAAAPEARPAAASDTVVAPAAPDTIVTPAVPDTVVAPAAPDTIVAPAARLALGRAIARAPRSHLRLIECGRDAEALLLWLGTPEGELLLEARPASPRARSYRVVDGLAWSYRGTAPASLAWAPPAGWLARPSPALLREIDRLLPQLGSLVRSAHGAAPLRSPP
jgi:radical SAM superfamily enzyme YgiQ (UPF0313 family)